MPTSGTEVFLGTVNGMYHSGDGGMTWQKSGLEGEVVLCLGTFPQPESSSFNAARRRRK